MTNILFISSLIRKIIMFFSFFEQSESFSSKSRRIANVKDSECHNSLVPRIQKGSWKNATSLSQDVPRKERELIPLPRFSYSQLAFLMLRPSFQTRWTMTEGGKLTSVDTRIAGIPRVDLFRCEDSPFLTLNYYNELWRPVYSSPLLMDTRWTKSLADT